MRMLWSLIVWRLIIRVNTRLAIIREGDNMLDAR